MKITALLLCFTVALLAGCINKPQITTGADGVSVTNFVKAPDVARISRIAGNAAQVGSLAYLTSKPGDRMYFVLANENLKSLISSSNYDAGALSAALQSLPIKELKGDQGAIAVMTAQMIVEDALDSAKDVVAKREMVAAVLLKVQAGIQKALDATGPRSSSENLGTYLGMIALRDGDSVSMVSAKTGAVLRQISYSEFREVYVLKTKPEYAPSKPSAGLNMPRIYSPRGPGPVQNVAALQPWAFR